MIDNSGNQARQMIDCEQVYATFRVADLSLRQRFSGSLAWKSVGGRRYLYRKINGKWKSLGPDSLQTQASFVQFHNGRTEMKGRRASLDAQLQAMAPVNRALRLGRVPKMAARILRRLDKEGVLGHGLRVVGTHALYAYERMGGIHFGGEVVATNDIDLLYDARGSLRLLSPENRQSGLIGILQSIDSSFMLVGPNSFRAANDKGFMVDLITPSTRNPATRVFKSRIGASTNDMTAVELDGLTWLESSPAIEQTTIDERGFPLTMVVPDPRAFACHKLWLSARDDRDPAKKRRDRLQALALVEMLETRVPSMPFDDEALLALPVDVRQLGMECVAVVRAKVTAHEPDWE